MSAAQVLKKVDPGCYVSRSRRLRISRNNFNFGLNRGADLTDLRKQSIWICCIETKLFGSESDGCIFYAVKKLDLFFHLRSTVSTAKVLQDVDTRRRCCAVGVVMAMFVFMILTATAAMLVVMVMMVMMFVLMILAAASTVIVMVMMVMMFVLALMILTATTAMFIVMVMVVVMFMFMILTATAAVLIVVFMVVMFFMRMFYMVMYIMMVVTASAGI